jgi:hypothetical protein
MVFLAFFIFGAFGVFGGYLVFCFSFAFFAALRFGGFSGTVSTDHLPETVEA